MRTDYGLTPADDLTRHEAERRAARDRHPEPLAVLPTVDEIAAAIHESGSHSDRPYADLTELSREMIARQARGVLALIEARIPHWVEVEPGEVIKAGTHFRFAWPDGYAAESVASRDWAQPDEDRRHIFIDPRTVPAEPVDPRIAVVEEWAEEISPRVTAADLLARLDAMGDPR